MILRNRSTRKQVKKPNLNKKIFTVQDFTYDEQNESYICRNTKVLRCNARAHRIRHIRYDIYRAPESDGAACPFRNKCLSKSETKRRYLVVPVEHKNRTLVEEMKARIDSWKGKQIYSRRLAIVDPVFANIRAQKRLDRFTLRTKAKVQCPVDVICAGAQY